MIVLLSLTILSAALPANPPYTPPNTNEISAIKARMAPLQYLSFAARYEYCGYLGYGADGALVFSEMIRGGHNGCTPVMPTHGVSLAASMHTHGAYDPGIPAEFPTALDMQSDAAEGVNGYIATPGGRLWYIDSRAHVAVQLCGPGCLPQDPLFHPGDDGVILQHYTYQDLRSLESQ